MKADTKRAARVHGQAATIPRVAHVGSFRPDSDNGVHQCIVALTRTLASRDQPIEVWHLTHRVREPSGRVVDGVQVFDLPSFQRRSVSAVAIPSVTRRWLRERVRHVDGVHLHSVFQSDHITVVKLGVPYILTPHGGYSDGVINGRRRQLKRIWFRLWERRLLEGARAVHVVSPAEEESLRQLGVSARVVHVPNGIEGEATSDRVSSYNASGPWVYMGRLAVVQKGLDHLLDAYAAATRERPQLPPLILAGPDFRDGLRQLEVQADRLDISGRVSFVGAVHGQAKEQLLSKASLFVHTSRWEGMPLAVLEAMRAGIPVLVTEATNVAAEVASVGAGFAAANRVSSVAGAMVAAFDASDLERAAMGVRARAHIRDRYSWPAITDEMSVVYREAFS
jgi:glycosyltransferase involved in cell wall biosynthesis